MNRIAVALLSISAVLGLGYAGVQVGYEVRETVLETRCTNDGKVPLWQASSPTDQRPDGALRFHCV